MSAPPIRTVGLTKRYGSLVALDALSIEVQPGEVFGFLGPNGAGKSTTVRLLVGLARASAGRAEILGHDVASDRAAALGHVAHVAGETSLWPTLRGSEVLELLGELHGGYDAVRTDALCERFELDPSPRGREYSKGNRQKVALVAAFASRADVLVFDEPTAGLDPLMEMVFRQCVAEASAEGRTVFLSSHVLSEVEATCDRVGIIRRGHLIEEGTLEGLRAVGARAVRVVFGGPVTTGLRDVAGVDDVTVVGSELRCRLHGAPDELIAALAAADGSIASMEIREPSLEELFLTYYGAP